MYSSYFVILADFFTNSLPSNGRLFSSIPAFRCHVILIPPQRCSSREYYRHTAPSSGLLVSNRLTKLLRSCDMIFLLRSRVFSTLKIYVEKGKKRNNHDDIKIGREIGMRNIDMCSSNSGLLCTLSMDCKIMYYITTVERPVKKTLGKTKFLFSFLRYTNIDRN
jgi:hypothetical protein